MYSEEEIAIAVQWQLMVNSNDNEEAIVSDFEAFIKDLLVDLKLRKSETI